LIRRRLCERHASYQIVIFGLSDGVTGPAFVTRCRSPKERSPGWFYQLGR
jgi:hypothetical protein